MATFTINSLADAAGDNTTGTIDGQGNGSGTLRQAINFANLNVANPGNTTTINTAAGLNGTVNLVGNLPLVATNVTLDGGGLTINGGNQFRGFIVSGIAANGQNAAATTVNIANLNFQNVTAQGGVGTGGGGGGLGAGGAVFVGPAANVNLTNVGFNGGRAVGGLGGVGDIQGQRSTGGGGGLTGNAGALNIAIPAGSGGGGILFNGGIGNNGVAAGDAGTGGGGGGGITSAGGDAMAGGMGGVGGRGVVGANGVALGGGGGGTGNRFNNNTGTAGAAGGTGATDGGLSPNSGVGGAGGFGGGGGGGFGGSGGTASFGGGGGGGSGNGGGGGGGFGGGGGSSNVGGGGSGGFGGGGAVGSGGSGTSGFGATATTATQGGNGAGLGGAVFVANGGQLTLSGTSAETGGTATQGGAAAGSGGGVFFQGGTAAAPATFNFGAGNQTFADAIADQTGSGGANVSNGLGGTGGVTALAKTGGGTLTLNGTNTYTGGTAIGASGDAASSTLQLGAAGAAGTGAITFASVSGNTTARLGLDVAAQPANGGTFTNRLANFGSGNELALSGLTNSSVSYNSANTSITVTGTRTGGGQVSENFVLSAPRTTSFTATADGNGGTVIRAATATNPTQPAAPAPCYVTGTRIRVLRGLAIQDVPVERLRVGDLAITAAGKPRPIRWIGTRSYPGLTAPQADRPVRIKVDAFSPGIPSRDLLVSPDHALWLDGLFAAAGHLVNGKTITRGEAVADLTYWHIELDTHDLLMADNTPAESFLAAPGVRRQFDGTGADSDAGTSPVPYASRAELGSELAALRRRLIMRADLSSEPTRFGGVRAWLDRCDGTRVAGWVQDAAHPDAPVCLDIVVDGAIVAMTVAEEYRADIAAAGVGDGRHGFDLGLQMPLIQGVPHVVEVRRSADDAVICAMRADAAGVWTPLLAA